MSNELGNAPIDPEYREKMRQVAATLDQLFNGASKGHDRTTGFVLLVFPFNGREGRANYISNAERATVVTMLKEQLAYFQGQPEVKGRA